MFETLITKLKGATRLWPCLLLAIITTAAVGVVYPQQIGLLIWSLTKIFWAVYLAYWLDRWVFWYARPGDYTCHSAKGLDSISLLMLRRAILMAAIAIAVGLGV
ncbi:putative holin [Salinicola sp. JS01]|uniref:putative holin n=1 Tax=Salinicola sp. JS01 TaxID=3050071 RepID=UPI00255C257E|nr:putative holin [Salinicola sp. JS01]WIX31231.1 putative holin [Salinicola sp. JS01]